VIAIQNEGQLITGKCSCKETKKKEGLHHWISCHEKKHGMQICGGWTGVAQNIQDTFWQFVPRMKLSQG